VGKKRVNVSGGAGYAIHKNSKFKAESWELVKFLTSELGQSFFMETGLVVPSRQSIREDNIFVRNVKYNWQVFNEESKYGQRVPQFRSSNDLIKFVDTELVPVWKGQQSAAQVMGKLPEKMLPLLSAIKT
jgi:ABC-type glycerol-3-phosphate transport system substrate-binding protein